MASPMAGRAHLYPKHSEGPRMAVHNHFRKTNDPEFREYK